MKHFSLGEDCCCGFGARETRAVAQSPNIRVFLVPQRVFIAIEISSRISKSRFSNIGMGAHGRNYVKEIEGASDAFLCFDILECGLISLDLHKWSLEDCFDVVACCHFSEGLGVLGNSEHDRVGLEKFHLDGEFGLTPLITPKIEDLLRSASALDGHSRLSKYRLALLYIFSQLGEFFSMI
jgi:hypothetical protein